MAFAAFLVATVPAYGQEPAHFTQEALALKNKADALLKKGNAKRAIAEYRLALEHTADSTALYFNLAIACYSDKKLGEASAALEKLLEFDPRDIEALYNLACLKICQSRPDQAKACLEKASLLCAPGSRFKPMIRQSLDFLELASRLEPTHRELLFSLLYQNGLPTA